MIQIEKNVRLDTLTTLGCLSEAEHFVRVTSKEEVIEALSVAEQNGWLVHILGAGANTIARSHVNGLVMLVDIRGFSLQETDEGALLTVGTGEVFDDVIARSLAAGYSGLENLSLIPGKVGGAVVQNIGAYGAELAENFVSVRVWDPVNKVERVLTLAECDFSYRHSIFKTMLASNFVILSAVLRVYKTFTPKIGYRDIEQVMERDGLTLDKLTAQKMREIIIDIRTKKLPDPKVIGNAGSFFTNPIVNKVLWRKILTTHPSLVYYPLAGSRMKLAAAWLIEAAGFKGFTDGPVGVYENHALILVNHGGATGEDIIRLARTIQKHVKDTFGIKLAMEPVIL